MERQKSKLENSPAARALHEYFWQSNLPLTMLVFLLPLLVFYEVGTLVFASDVARQMETRVLAFNLMARFLALFGAYGRFLPGLLVVGILFFWHLARRDRWVIHWSAAMGIGLESLLLSFPLLAIGMLVRTYLPLAARGHSLAGGVVLAVGAGIYEELVFRLICITLLNVILIDLLRISKRPGRLLMVLISAVLFAAYHYWSPVSPPFRAGEFIFRTLSGIYFGILFMTRGFAVTSGTHAAYDIYYFLFRAVSGH